MIKNKSNKTNVDETFVNEQAASTKESKKARIVRRTVIGGVAGLFLGTVGMAAKEAAGVADAADGADVPEIVGNDGSLDDLSFSKAFSEARAQLGPGEEFEWHGGRYSTSTEEEWNEAHPSQQVEQAEEDSVNQPSEADVEVVAGENSSDENEVEILGVEDQGADGDELDVEIVTGGDINGEEACFVNLEADEVLVDSETSDVTDAVEDVFVGDSSDDAVIV